MTKFYAIERLSGIDMSQRWFVRARLGKYGGMGTVPTLFASRSLARSVQRDYRQISKNSGKQPSELKIIEVEI